MREPDADMNACLSQQHILRGSLVSLRKQVQSIISSSTADLQLHGCPCPCNGPQSHQWSTGMPGVAGKWYLIKANLSM